MLRSRGGRWRRVAVIGTSAGLVAIGGWLAWPVLDASAWWAILGIVIGVGFSLAQMMGPPPRWWRRTVAASGARSLELQGQTERPALPSGVVTFMHTEVEGSTRLWDARPAEMRDAVRCHDDLVESVVADGEGQLFFVGRRGFGVAFARADAAVATAQAIQVALGKQIWPGEIALRVRIGVHAGEAEATQGSYFGVTVNRAARLASIGSGGQTLVSEATAALVRDSETAFELVDLGLHRLRDLTRPEHIYQLGREAHPPLPTGELTPTNLAAEVTSLLGREEELADLDVLLETERLVTLVGAGGVGKSRLAARAARRSLDSQFFRGGVWLVELGQTEAEESLIAQVTSSLALRVEDHPSVTALVDHLRGSNALLVLDNCEHLIRGVAVLVDELLSRCPHLTILATSRELLKARGERVVPITPLTAEHAVHLLAERVGHDASAWGEEERRTAELLCDRLDRVPLALELAAMRVRTLGVNEVATHLDDRFRLLGADTNGQVERQQTLRATLAWSFELLPRHEQDGFVSLAPLVGPFDLEASTAAIDGHADKAAAISILAGLIDKSMVERIATPRGASRYRLLDTIRAYGLEQLESRGANEPTRDRIALHYVTKYRTLRRNRFVEAELEFQDGLLEDIPNIRASVGWLIERRRLDAVMSLLLELPHMSIDAGWWEPLQWIDELLDDGQLGEHPRYAEALSWSAVRALLFRGDIGLARRLALESIEVAPDKQQPLRALWTLGTADIVEGKTDDALNHFDQMLADAADLDDPSNYYYALFARAAPLAVAGRDNEVAMVADAMLRGAERTKSHSLLGFAYLARGYALSVSDPAAAPSAHRAALDIGRTGPHHSLVALTWPDLIRLELETRSLDATAAELRQFFEWHRDNGIAQPINILIPLRTAAELAARTGQHESAVTLDAAHNLLDVLPGEGTRYRQSIAESQAAVADRVPELSERATMLTTNELIDLALTVCE